MGCRYYISNRLTEESDVYSFGVVLLEIITSRPLIERKRNDEYSHIRKWVSIMLSNGDIENIVDPSLQGDFDTNPTRKAVEIAMACVSTDRPNMNYVETELAKCLSSEIDRTTRRGDENVPQESVGNGDHEH